MILALHGFTGRGSDFLPLKDVVEGEWHCPDMPGHGPVPQIDCTPEATATYIQSQYLQVSQSTATPQKERLLIGYSMGARAALIHALRYPRAWDALVLISLNPGIEDQKDRENRVEKDEALAQKIERGGVSAFLDYWKETPLIQSQQQLPANWRNEMQRARLAHTSTGLATSLREFGQGSCPNLWPNLSKLKVPTLLLSGQEDRKYSEIAARTKSVFESEQADCLIQHVGIEGASHMPHLEQLDKSGAAITLFLSGLDS
ncbi:MAG: alpha/beta fold hydrolase [Verrucomicrobiota bacterium]